MLRFLDTIIQLPLRLIARLKVRPPDEDAFVEELWSIRWKRPRTHRFVPETEEAYQTTVGADGLTLATNRKHLFAWTDDPLYRYRDFVLTARIRLPDPSVHAAAGLLVRKRDDGSFYDFLVSNAKRYRFDAVFNGNQIPLIPWTSLEPVDDSGAAGDSASAGAGFVVTLTIVARGDRFAFLVDGEWVGEIVDDRLPSGTVAFAVQNFADADRVVCTVEAWSIDSRPVEIEAAWYRWNSFLPIDPERRTLLARSLAGMGQYVAAGVQLRLVAKRRPLEAEELLLLANCFAESGRREEALEAVEEAITRVPDYREALVTKAELLYLTDRLVELADHFDRYSSAFATLPGVWNLKGNCEYGLGRFADSAASYRRAIELQDDVPPFYANLARSLERLGSKDEALESYTAASALLFREESYDELERLLARIESIAPGRAETRSLRAKLAFHDGNLRLAGELLSPLVDEGSSDSSVHYLHGLLLAKEGDRRAADAAFSRAVELEPEAAIYRFRLAENRYLSGEDATAALDAALEVSGGDARILQLAALIDLDENRPERAAERLEAACRSSDDPEIIANLGEALYRAGRREEAFAVLAASPAYAACADEAGRLLLLEGHADEAIAAFERAAALEPGTAEYREHLAAACIDTDQVHRAEEIVSSLIDESPTAERYNLMGHIAAGKGEYARAESSYREAMVIDPENDTYACNLVEHYLNVMHFETAAAAIEEFLSGRSGERVVHLAKRLREATETTISCAACGRVWRVPKRLEPQGRLVLRGEPPAESPAGRCLSCGEVFCVACATVDSDEGRFLCPKCGERLKLTDDALKHLAGTHAS